MEVQKNKETYSFISNLAIRYIGMYQLSMVTVMLQGDPEALNMFKEFSNKAQAMVLNASKKSTDQIDALNAKIKAEREAKNRKKTVFSTVFEALLDLAEMAFPLFFFWKKKEKSVFERKAACYRDMTTYLLDVETDLLSLCETHRKRFEDYSKVALMDPAKRAKITQSLSGSSGVESFLSQSTPTKKIYH